MVEARDTYPALKHLRVGDAMHPGLISCSLDAPLRTVARMMATYRVHAILITAHGQEQLPRGGVWGVVSDTDLLRAARHDDLDRETARTIAGTPVLTVEERDELGHAAELMSEHGVPHVVVLESHTGQPLGVLSSLDVARALAGFPERHPGTS